MIVKAKPGLREVLFTLHGSIVPRIIGRLLVLAGLSVAAVLLARVKPSAFAHLAATPFTVMGLALSIFISFRNNACYERWWEGRKLWGQLLVTARAIARQLGGLPVEARAPVLLGVAAFTQSLAARLRDQDEVTPLAAWRSDVDWRAAPNPTDLALAQIARAAEGLAGLDTVGHALLQTRLHELGTVQAGCERIKGTPLPFAYWLLLHRTALAFCMLLPFALASSLGWWTPLLTIIVGYTFFGLDALGDELEDPFGSDLNDLPLDALSRTVEREMLFAAGREVLPPALAPQRDVLT